MQVLYARLACRRGEGLTTEVGFLALFEGERAMGVISVIAWLEIATGLGLAIFWLLFFTGGIAPSHPPPGYYAFEQSFVLSDIVLSAALLVAAALLYYKRNWGRILSLTCAGGLIFLALVDFGFNVRNGMYTTDLVAGVAAAAINFWCLGIGVFITAMIAVSE